MFEVHQVPLLSYLLKIQTMNSIASELHKHFIAR